MSEESEEPVAADLPDSPFHTTGTDHVTVWGSNAEDTIAFYRDAVGLAVQHRGGERATLGAGGEPLLELTADPDAPDRPRRSAGLFHTAFRVPSRAALADALDRIEEEWELTGASDHHVSEALYLDDPEGNGVEVYRDRPREEWPTDGSGRVEMDTLPLDRESDGVAVELARRIEIVHDQGRPPDRGLRGELPAVPGRSIGVGHTPRPAGSGMTLFPVLGGPARSGRSVPPLDNTFAENSPSSTR